MSLDIPDLNSLPQDIAALQQRITELEQQLAQYQHTEGFIPDATPKDTTKQQLSAETLSQFAALIEATSDCVIVANAQGYLMYINQAGRQMIGLEPEQAIATLPITQFVPEAMHSVLQKHAIPSALRNGSWSGEMLLLRNDGRHIPVSQVILAHKHQDGRPVYLSTVMRDISTQKQSEENIRVYEEVVKNMRTGMTVFQLEQPDDLASLRLIAANSIASHFAGRDFEAEIGRLLIDFAPEAFETGLAQTYADVALSGQSRDLGEVSFSDERITDAIFAVWAFPMPNNRVSIAFEDITERKRAEEALRRSLLQEEVIHAQEAALAELSTPLLSISENMVVMPLIGSVDSRRAQQVLDTLLEGVAASNANVVVLDITGVSVVDTQVANALIRAAQAVRLLGAQVVLTGIRPEVAQTLVGLGVDLGGIITQSTLQSGIASAFQRRL
ncbi:MAG: PAS domain S-box protein [Chloroflexales bacterium]|nr:PAS domain S-box protein [Chloroflexales bacterium]